MHFLAQWNLKKPLRSQNLFYFSWSWIFFWILFWLHTICVPKICQSNLLIWNDSSVWKHKVFKKKVLLFAVFYLFKFLFCLVPENQTNLLSNQIFKSILLDFLKFTIHNIMHNHYSFLLDVKGQTILEGNCEVFNSTKRQV